LGLEPTVKIFAAAAAATTTALLFFFVYRAQNLAFYQPDILPVSQPTVSKQIQVEKAMKTAEKMHIIYCGKEITVKMESKQA